jgi:hypothetical protein
LPLGFPCKHGHTPSRQPTNNSPELFGAETFNILMGWARRAFSVHVQHVPTSRRQILHVRIQRRTSLTNSLFVRGLFITGPTSQRRNLSTSKCIIHRLISIPLLFCIPSHRSETVLAAFLVRHHRWPSTQAVPKLPDPNHACLSSRSALYPINQRRKECYTDTLGEAGSVPIGAAASTGSDR